MDISNSASQPYDIMVDNYVIKGNKDEDGRFRPIMEVLDPDLSKDNLLIEESVVSSVLLKTDDRYNNYFWNSSGKYFLNDVFI